MEPKKKSCCIDFFKVICCPFILLFYSTKIYCCGCVGSYLRRFFLFLYKYLCCCCYKYKDKHFKPGQLIIGDVKSDTAKYGPYGQKMENYVWVRAGEFGEGKKMRLFEDGICSTDICQGQLGNCWMLAAMATLAEREGAIERLFVTKELDPRGKYHVRLFDPIKRKWKIITIDDYLPIDKKIWEKNKKVVPKFSNPSGNEIWVMILEKAFAKLCGSYASLEGGQELWALSIMTGGDHARMYRKNGSAWKRLDMELKPNKENQRGAVFKPVPEKFTDDQFWEVVLGFYRADSVMCVAGGGMGGLISGHAYSILQVRENHHRRFVQLRNPWGKGEWKGPWSDSSTLWKDNPSIAKSLKFSPADDGAFWMEWSDFVMCWNEVSVCHRSVDISTLRFNHAGYGCCAPCGGCLKGCCEFWCCDGCHRLYCAHESSSATLKAKRGCCSCCCSGYQKIEV
eukprot:GHVL01027663.1.p1 GENE.GHVL01027663.1~~GHVL01027663.1.p1  ORF type:complete len:453 (-),score=81.63 GHVL01027663.1:342-1700(-)